MKQKAPTLTRSLNILFGLLASFAFMTLWPYQPNVTWISEATALILALVITAIVFWRTRQNRVLEVNLYTGVLLSLLVLIGIGTFFKPPSYFGITWVSVTLLFTATLLSLTVTRLQSQGLNVLVPLAWGLFIGSVLQSLFGIVQITGGLYTYDSLVKGGPFWIPRANPLAEASGFLFQKNQLADYITLGTLAGVYLVSTGRLRSWIFWIITPLTGFILAATTSRTVFLYIPVLFVLAFMKTEQKQEAKTFRKLILGFLGVVLVFQVLYPFMGENIKNLSPKAVTGSAVDRLDGDGHGVLGYRKLLWREAFKIFVDDPIIGVGLANYPIRRAEVHASLDFDRLFYKDQQFFNHTHNMILQILVELGIVATLILLIGLGWGVWRLYRHQRTPERDLALASILIVLTHSQVEHPLWFAYFLMVFTVLFSSHKLPSLTLNVGRSLPVAAFTSLILSGAIAVSIYDYGQLVSVAGMRAGEPVQARELKVLQRLSKHTLFDGLADIFVLFRLMDQSDRYLNDKLALTAKLVRFRPVEFTLFRRALYLGYAGKTEEALYYLKMAYYLAPSSPKQMAAWFMSVPNDPRLAPLGKQIAQFWQQYEADQKRQTQN